MQRVEPDQTRESIKGPANFCVALQDVREKRKQAFVLLCREDEAGVQHLVEAVEIQFQDKLGQECFGVRNAGRMRRSKLAHIFTLTFD